MKRNLISGLILLLPLTITVGVFIFLIDFLTAPFTGYMESLLQFLANNWSIDIDYHKTALLIISRIFILILLFVSVLLLGFLGNRLIFNWLVKTMHLVMGKIPLINSIYRLCRDIIEALLSEKKKLFSRVVVLPFPCAESKALGLVTGNAPHVIQEAYPVKIPHEALKAVFVPTSPHPISGFILLTEEKHLKSVNMSIEDAFKFLISCGLFTPESNKKEGDDGHEKETKNPILSNKE